VGGRTASQASCSPLIRQASRPPSRAPPSPLPRRAPSSYCQPWFEREQLFALLAASLVLPADGHEDHEPRQDERQIDARHRRRRKREQARHRHEPAEHMSPTRRMSVSITVFPTYFSTREATRNSAWNDVFWIE